MKKVISFVLLGLIVQAVHSQSSGPQPSAWDAYFERGRNATIQLNQRDSLERWEERVYVHTDREQFTPGEHLFFKAYMVNRKTQQRWSPSKVLRLELRNAENKLVDKQYHALNNGVSEGAFKLSGKISEGSYQLIAYTRWMQNYGEDVFFRKSIQIGSEELPAADRDNTATLEEIAFFPEGGSLVSGLSNRMVIYGSTSTGNPVPFQAVITDGDHNSNLQVNTYAEGMGQVTFTPMAGKKYVLCLDDGREFALPEVKKSGYTLKINNLDPQQVFVQSEIQGVTTGENIYVQGFIDDKLCFESELSYNEQGIAKLEVSKSGLPMGKIDFRLVDVTGTRLAERPIWISRIDQLNIQIEPLTSRKGKSDQLTYKITVRDQNGEPVETDLSMAVRTNTAYQVPSTPYNGRTERFLQDLKVFGKSDTAESDGSFPEEIIYPMQQGLEIVGYAYDLKNELLINKDIQLLGLTDSLWVAREVRTDASGLLRIRDLDFEGDTQIIFRAKGEDTRERLVKVVPLSETTLDKKVKLVKKARKMKNMVLETTPWQPMDTTGLIALDPATVTGVKKQKQEYNTQFKTYISAQDVIVQDPARPRSLLELINELPGINVLGIGSPNPQIRILRRGGLANAGPPLWVIDGVPLFQNVSQDVPGSIFAQTAVGLVPALAIDRVEFLFGPPAAMYGTRASSGVFMIYTRDGADSDYIRRKDGQLKFKGFTPKPDIDQVLREQRKKRKRNNIPVETLYWNPSLQTDAQGQVLVAFKAPANTGEIELQVESITERGLRGSQKQVFPAFR